LKPWGKRRRKRFGGRVTSKSLLRRRRYRILALLFRVSSVVHRLIAAQFIALTVEESEKSRREMG
jgi:hypothetical protein